MTEYPVVRVTWLDTTRFEGWWNDSEMRGICTDPPSAYAYTTVGYLIHKDRHCVVLSPSIRVKGNGSYGYGDPYRFPSKQVTKLEVLDGISNIQV